MSCIWCVIIFDKSKRYAEIKSTKLELICALVLVVYAIVCSWMEIIISCHPSVASVTDSLMDECLEANGCSHSLKPLLNLPRE